MLTGRHPAAASAKPAQLHPQLQGSSLDLRHVKHTKSKGTVRKAVDFELTCQAGLFSVAQLAVHQQGVIASRADVGMT